MARATPEQDFRDFRRTGNPESLGRVFDAFAPNLLILAGHLAHDTASAEDLVQSTFLDVIRAAATFDEGCRLQPWLVRILVNRARMVARRAQARPGADEPEPADRSDPAADAENREFAQALSAAIDSLPPTYREVLNLRLVHGLEPRQIAHTLGRPLETVKTQLRRGNQLLRDSLPRSLVGLATFDLGVGRGLGAARDAVLSDATAHAPVAAAPTVPGVLAMKKLILLPVSVVIGISFLVGTALIWSRPFAADAEVDVTAPSLEGDTAAAPGLAAVADAPPARTSLDAGTPSPGSPERTLTVRVHFAPGGEPAAGVLVRTTPRGGGPLASSPWRATGDDGTVRFGNPPAGLLRVEADRGVSVAVDTTAPRTEAKLEIPVGIDVAGEVVDGEGRPVAGAGIWLSTRGGDQSGAIVAHADAAGRFTLRSVAAWRCVTSFAPDRGFGHGQAIEGEPGTMLEIRLIAAATRDGTLRGIVVTDRGEPLPEATVMIGPSMSETGHSFSDYEKRVTYPPPTVLRTDARGEFIARGLSTGFSHSVWVGAPGFAPWHRTVEANSPSTIVRIEMQRGAAVRGTIVDAARAAVPSCEVRTLQAGIDPAEGMAYQGPAWARSVAFTDEAGEYELSGLRPGSMTVIATHRELGTARRDIELSPAQVADWSPELALPRELYGFVVDPDGNPLTGWSVGTRLVPGLRPTDSTRTDATGRFVLKNCEEATYDCTFSQVGSAMTNSALIVRGLSPSVSPHRVVVPADRIASSYATGSVVDENGAALPELRLDFERVMGDGTSQPSGFEGGGGEGTVRAGPLLPGQYTVWARRSYKAGRLKLGEFTLRAGETVDLGRHAFTSPGHIEVFAFDDSDTPTDLRTVVIKHLDAVMQAEDFFTVTGGSGLSRPLQPGEYAVFTFGSDTAMAYATATVRPAETAKIELRIPRGVVRKVQLPATPTRNCNLTTIWRNADGQVRMKFDTGDHQTHRPRTISLRFAPGTWEVEVATPAAPSAFATFRIDDCEDPEQVLVLPSPFDAPTGK